MIGEEGEEEGGGQVITLVTLTFRVWVLELNQLCFNKVSVNPTHSVFGQS